MRSRVGLRHTYVHSPLARCDFAETSKNLTIRDNAIVQNGCEQGRPPYFAGRHSPAISASGDVGSIAFVLPGGFGSISSNLVVKCADTTAPLWGGPESYRADFSFQNNDIIEASEAHTGICALPELQWDTRVATWPNLIASCDTPGAAIRYTLDGSRPTEASPLWPPNATVAESAVAMHTTPVLVRAFKDGMWPSPTDGYVRYV